MSQERRQALYNAIAEPIMDLRVDLRMGKLDDGQLNHALFRLEQEIDRRQEAVLKSGRTTRAETTP